VTIEANVLNFITYQMKSHYSNRKWKKTL
ncbi:hypothetical protein TorRG33x02_106250, partial [Trema orientale]